MHCCDGALWTMDAKGDRQEEIAPLQLEALGPIVLNSDGSMSRIPNWAEMSSEEKASAQRLIAKRNARRKDELLLKLSEEDNPLPLPGAAAPPISPTAQEEGSMSSGLLFLPDCGSEAKK